MKCHSLIISLVILAGIAAPGLGATDTAKETSEISQNQKKICVKRTERALERGKTVVSDLKAERGNKGKDTAEYRAIEAKINNLDAKINETEHNLADLKSATGDAWRDYESKVSNNVATLEKIEGSRPAE